MKLDRTSPVPAYYQILIDLEKRITAREWNLGQAMPSENELAKYYRVSRVTIRQATEKLAAKGVVRKKRGQGTFLAKIPEPVEKDLSYPTEYKEKVMHFGISLQASVISLEEVIDSKYAALLELKPDEPLIRIRRLFTSNGLPYSLNDSWLPAKLIPGISETGLINNSLSQSLREGYGIVPVVTDNWIEAITAEPEIEKYLELRRGSVLISITTVEKSKKGCPIEYSVTYWIKERIRFHFSRYHAEAIERKRKFPGAGP